MKTTDRSWLFIVIFGIFRNFTFSIKTRYTIQRNSYGFPYGVQVNFSAVGTLLQTTNWGYSCSPCYWSQASYYQIYGGYAVYGMPYNSPINTTYSTKNTGTNSKNFPILYNTPDTTSAISSLSMCGKGSTTDWIMLGAYTISTSNFVQSGYCIWPCIMIGAFGQSKSVFQKLSATLSSGSYSIPSNLNNNVNWYYVPTVATDTVIPISGAMGFSLNGTGVDITQGYDRCGAGSTSSQCGPNVKNYYSAYRLSWIINSPYKIGGHRAGSLYPLWGSVPSSVPSGFPTGLPTSSTYRKMAYVCNYVPSTQPSASPTSQPSKVPTAQPTSQPSRQPTTQPSSQPTRQPTSQPSAKPSRKPSSQPTRQPTRQPVGQPTSQPTTVPSHTAHNVTRDNFFMGQAERMKRSSLGIPNGVQTNFSFVGTLVETNRFGYICSPCFWNTPQYYVSANGYGTYAAPFGTEITMSATAQATSGINSAMNCNTNSQYDYVMFGAFAVSSKSYIGSTLPLGTCVFPCILVGAWGQTNIAFTTTAYNKHVTSNNVNWYSYTTGSIGFTQNGTIIDIVGGLDQCGVGIFDVTYCGSASKNYYAAYRLSWLVNTAQKKGGGRAGQVTNLYSSTLFYKMAYLCVFAPSGQPSSQPSIQPSGKPSKQPSMKPTMQPTIQPSMQPSKQPSSAPTSVPTTSHPTDQPSIHPTCQPSQQPTMKPSKQPTSQPSMQPSQQPFSHPSSKPSAYPTYGGSQNYEGYRAYNHYAFAVVGKKGNVITWGDPISGGNSDSVASQISSGVAKVVGSKNAFVAIKSSGTIVLWGAMTQPPNVLPPPTLTNVSTVTANDYAFAAMLHNGSVVPFGNPYAGGDLYLTTAAIRQYLTEHVKSVFANSAAFVAVRSDGTMATWGKTICGGGITSANTPSIMNIKRVHGNKLAFAAVDDVQTLMAWGNPAYGGNVVTVPRVEALVATTEGFAALAHDRSLTVWGYQFGANMSQINPYLGPGSVEHVAATDTAFAALLTNGSILCWGDFVGGGYMDDVVINARDVWRIYSNNGAFVALSSNGRISLAWGDPFSGGYLSSSAQVESLVAVQAAASADFFSLPTWVQSGISKNVKNIYSTGQAFAALRSDGNVYVWGNSMDGGLFPNAAKTIHNVSFICSNEVAFYAVKSDGSVYSWGVRTLGGDSSAVASKLKSANITSCA